MTTDRQQTTTFGLLELLSAAKNMVYSIFVFLLLLRGDSTAASSAEVSDCFKVNIVTLATIIAKVTSNLKCVRVLG